MSEKIIEINDGDGYSASHTKKQIACIVHSKNRFVTVIAAARLIAIQTKEQLARITKNRFFVLKVT